jgi:hypothetical protein
VASQFSIGDRRPDPGDSDSERRVALVPPASLPADRGPSIPREPPLVDLHQADRGLLERGPALAHARGLERVQAQAARGPVQAGLLHPLRDGRSALRLVADGASNNIQRPKKDQ